MGLEASKKRGKVMGRPKLDKEKLAVALRMYDSKEYSIKEIVSSTGISQVSLYPPFLTLSCPFNRLPN